MKVLGLLLIAGILIAGVVLGCGRTEKFGEAIGVIETTRIKDILANPSLYTEKTVKVAGKIIRECSTGCWFDLQDQTGAIYVNLSPAGLAISQKAGKMAVVQGEVKSKDNRVEIYGKGVEFK